MKNQLLLFWKIGQLVFKNEQKYENVFYEFSKLCSYYFGITCMFSRDNIRYMRNFYCVFPIYYDDLNKLTWEHYRLLLDISDKIEQYFYFRVAIFCRSSVQELRHLISNNMYNKIKER